MSLRFSKFFLVGLFLASGALSATTPNPDCPKAARAITIRPTDVQKALKQVSLSPEAAVEAGVRLARMFENPEIANGTSDEIAMVVAPFKPQLQLTIERSDLSDRRKLETIHALNEFADRKGILIIAGKNNKWCGAARACFSEEKVGQPPIIIIESLSVLTPDVFFHELRHSRDQQKLVRRLMAANGETRDQALERLTRAASPARSRFYEDRAHRDETAISLKRYGIEMQLRHIGRVADGKVPAKGTEEYRTITRLMEDHASLEVRADAKGPMTFRSIATHLGYFDKPNDIAYLDQLDAIFVKEVANRVVARELVKTLQGFARFRARKQAASPTP